MRNQCNRSNAGATKTRFRLKDRASGPHKVPLRRERRKDTRESAEEEARDGQEEDEERRFSFIARFRGGAG